MDTFRLQGKDHRLSSMQVLLTKVNGTAWVLVHTFSKIRTLDYHLLLNNVVMSIQEGSPVDRKTEWSFVSLRSHGDLRTPEVGRPAPIYTIWRYTMLVHLLMRLSPLHLPVHDIPSKRQ